MAMPDTADPAVATIVDDLRAGIAEALQDRLAGLYLTGSLIAGDFDAAVSDIDCVALLTAPPTERELQVLRPLHTVFVERHPAWADRIEVVYAATTTVNAWATATDAMIVISPGEPIHLITAGADWVLSWYPARAEGVSLIGPPISSLVRPVAEADFIVAVTGHMRRFADRVPDDASPGSQAYAILTICRGMLACTEGVRASKRVAAEWAMAEFPQWAALVADALQWRQGQWNQQPGAGAATVGATRAFVADMSARIPRDGPGPR